MKYFCKSIKEHLFTIFVVIVFAALLFVICKVSYDYIYLPYATSFNHQVAPVATKSLEASSQLRAEWGQLGDYFGGTLNPIFGFASFIALLVTILYQARELNASTKELKNSATALAAQNKAIELQSFEQTFFSWLNNYHILLESINFDKKYSNSQFDVSTISRLNGRSALNEFYRIYILSGSLDEDTVIDKWESLYKAEEYQLDSLFRTLYRLLIWIDAQAQAGLSHTQKWLYISIIRSQLSYIEMIFIFLNCMTKRGQKFKLLVEKYAIFDNLSLESDELLQGYSKNYLNEAFNSELAREKLNLPKSFEETLALVASGPLAAPSA